MELRHLRYFVAVAEELNFTRAAKRLGINQPPLSLQIRQLEKELGTPLFIRRTRGVELTNAGKLMLEEARVILKEVETAKAGVQRSARGETGRIVIGFSGGTYFHPLIPAIIREYRTDYPDVILFPQVKRHCALDRATACRTDRHRVCAAADRRRGRSWRSSRLSMSRPSWWCRPCIRLAGRPQRRFGRSPGIASFSIRARSILAFMIWSWPRAIRRGSLRCSARRPRRSRSVIPLVAAGLGVSIVPQSMSRILLDGVSYLAIEGDAPRVKICLAYRRDDRNPPNGFVAVARRANVRPSREKYQGAADPAKSKCRVLTRVTASSAPSFSFISAFAASAARMIELA